MRLHEWVNTLPDGQQQEFYKAQARQLSMREAKIANGSLKVEGLGALNNNYVWRDEDAARINKPYDEIWQAYFDRYLKETQTCFEIVKEIIDGEQ